MQMKLGRSISHRQIIDKFGRLFIEEFQHFVRINEEITSQYLQQSTVPKAPSSGGGSSGDENWAKRNNPQKQFKEDLPKPTYEDQYQPDSNESDEEDEGETSGLDIRGLGAAHYNEEKHGYSKKRKYDGGKSNVGPLKKKRKLNFK